MWHKVFFENNLTSPRSADHSYSPQTEMRYWILFQGTNPWRMYPLTPKIIGNILRCYTYFILVLYNLYCNIFLQQFSNLSKTLTHVKQLLGISFEHFSWVITYLSFCPILSTSWKYLLSTKRMQQKILLTITWSDRCCTLICNILSLFHFIVHGMIGMSWVHFKEIYFILYSMQFKKMSLRPETNNGN